MRGFSLFQRCVELKTSFCAEERRLETYTRNYVYLEVALPPFQSNNRSRVEKDRQTGVKQQYSVIQVQPFYTTRHSLSGTTRVSRYQKTKPSNLDFLEQETLSEWQWQRL